MEIVTFELVENDGTGQEFTLFPDQSKFTDINKAMAAFKNLDVEKLPNESGFYELCQYVNDEVQPFTKEILNKFGYFYNETTSWLTKSKP